MDEPIIITGAAGLIGGALFDWYERQGKNVTGIHRRQTARFTGCDVTNVAETEAMIKRLQPALLFHFAGQNDVTRSWDDPVSTMIANVFSTITLLHAVTRHAPHCRVVIAGSVIASPDHPYGLSKKLQIETALTYASLYGRHVLVLSPCNVTGTGAGKGVCPGFAGIVAAAEKNGEPAVLTLSNAQQPLHLLDVRDCIRAIDALAREGVSGHRSLSTDTFTLGELADLFAAEATVPVRIIDDKKPLVPTPGPVAPYTVTRTVPIRQTIQELLAEQRARAENANP